MIEEMSTQCANHFLCHLQQTCIHRSCMSLSHKQMAESEFDGCKHVSGEALTNHLLP